MKIIGSAAAASHGLLNRWPKDVDMVSDKEYDSIYIDDGYLNVDLKVWPKHIYNMLKSSKGSVIPDQLYTIKLSHIFWDIKWRKHMSDLLVMRMKGCKVDEELYTALYNYWCEVHGDKSFLSLKKVKDQFFNDHVPYIYDHDYLHEVVAYYDKPLYNRVLKDGEDVLIDKDKYLTQLSFYDRIRMIREEAYVIALERWLIPQDFKISTGQAYSYALKKMITNLTKGWFARYIVDNYEHIWKLDRDHDFVKLFKERDKTNDRYYKQ